MPFLHKFTLGKNIDDKPLLEKSELASIKYHDIFDYPLTTLETIKWSVGEKGLKSIVDFPRVSERDGYYFVEGRDNLTYKRLLKERTSKGKLAIARKAAQILSQLPTIRGVFITGALSMENTVDNSDIDLMIITRRNTLWTTRLLSYLVLNIFGLKIRKSGTGDQKDRLCLNIWLDESLLSWDKKERNIYSAHEIAQVVPIINKDFVYERFLQKNSWIKDYWPNAVKIESEKYRENKVGSKPCLIEKIAFWIQYRHMKNKITREAVTIHKGIFHPNNWSKFIIQRLSS